MGYTHASLKKQDSLRHRLGFSNTSIGKTYRGDYALRYYNDDVVTWTPKYMVLAWDYQGSAQKARINYALPFGTVKYDTGKWVLHLDGKRYLMRTGMRITNDRRVIGALSYAKWWRKAGPAVIARRRESARLGYWRGIRNATLRPRNGTPPPPNKLTVEKILGEKNTTIRMVMAATYGIEKFLTDAKTEVVNSEAGYDLLRFSMGEAARWPGATPTPQFVSALKMACPSTGTVYIETVPPQMENVRQALDWRYNTTGYLDRVGQQT